MIRNRDIVALVMIVILSRMAWDDSTESLSASANLAFYLPRDKSTTSSVVTPMDVDGDGTNEALAMVKSQGSTWVLEILDLKRLHQQSKTTLLAPFRPSVLFTSEPVTLTNASSSSAVPVKLSTGHLVIANPRKKTTIVHPKVENNPDITDTNRKYFCGKDWHDASERCGTPCPEGQSSECPDDEKCFADTPCDVLNYETNDEVGSLEFLLTPGGGLPSLMTLWSNGDMTLHSLMQDKELSIEEGNTKKRSKSNRNKLELRQQWHVNIFPPNTVSDDILWEEASILFLDTFSSQQAGAENGILVVSGSYYLDGSQKRGSNSFVLALDAMSGKMLWENFINENMFGEQNMPLPLARGSTSFARRRSRVPALQDNEGGMVEVLPNCAVVLKHHLKEVLPFSYFGPQDANLKATHLDWTKRDHHKTQHMSKHDKQKGHDNHKRKKKWHDKHKHPIVGRPNVLVAQSQGSLQIRSLKNGSPLCHMSLLEETVYSDLNNDGIMDQVQVLLDSKRTSPRNEKWIWQLTDKIKNNRKELKDNGARQQLLKTHPNLCHAMVLSGVPANEELFSTSLCGTSRGNSNMNNLGDHPVSASLDYVAPVIVESLSGRRNTRDIIVALNNGMVHRLQGRSGRREWTTIGSQHYDNFPTWEMTKEQSNALLTKISSKNVAPAIQPLLLAGENSLAILSVKTGAVLASASFPQTSISRPILAEVSGDGTTDVLIFSTDGIWGIQLSVHAGSRVALRILTGLLFMGLMLAVLANRFGQKKDKRSTDI
jgi:hypothetical protein